ncbi:MULTISPECIES: iron-containing redox enzyme family protein [Burkholderia]|uniref:iron-containing redox enzyme family protein n=1 Tax=Burkholderia TaxID=32008 RepID=UPI00138E12D9|nr:MULTISPECIES: iron-containing redox enzyme family protein [Burkholderia]MBX3803426.1 iron-containing redox enzyme family protein [Burkholderia cepacia]MBX3925799.1 iron-containing redox enzyme family protein [Burkholderia cepacia]MBX3939876.1 iron-containing redox enzyme family protein [Burkholderia cepacia]MBX3958082.1 iron-containing redox enzyme family protein [Burkholderia cepacia]MBX3978678.1 iron-containing redox enzyme family protein [Burkholderia cepacia]
MNSLPLTTENFNREGGFSASTRSLLVLREQLIIDHPVNSRIRSDTVALFEFFELYAYFVYDFAAYVSALFASVSDLESKKHIYDNLLDEIGIQPCGTARWERHHGELYRRFLESLRRTQSYRDAIDVNRMNELDALSRGISRRFYDGHQRVLRAGDDCVALAAFSSIEGWVSRQYAIWRDVLGRAGEEMRFLDMRTIDLHCECDVEHSRVLDEILTRFVGAGETTVSLHAVNSGLLRGIELSVDLFDDIQHALSQPAQMR